MTTPAQPHAIILAAGRGKRMASDLPKVLFPVADKPMVWWVVQACLTAGVDRCILVVGYGGDQVRAALADIPQCQFVEQPTPQGTGHAARMAAPVLAAEPDRDVFVLAGDAPLIRPHTLDQLLQVHRQTHASATLATAMLDDPAGYGRVIRDAAGRFDRIVEQRDAAPAELQIREINPSYYCFRAGSLFDSLEQVSNQNSQGEYYLTDVPALLKARGETVSLVDAVPAEDVLGVNTPEQLAVVDHIMRNRIEAA